MNELKYCKFCDKEKPVKDFVKSGFAIKNICRECQNQKQTQIYKNNKKVEQLQEENKRLKDNWDELKEYIDIKLYNVEYLQKLCGCRIDDEIHITLDIIKKKMQELESSDSNE